VVTHDASALSRQVTRVAFVNRRLRELAPAPAGAAAVAGDGEPAAEDTAFGEAAVPGRWQARETGE
jgi:hypothetical protein